MKSIYIIMTLIILKCTYAAELVEPVFDEDNKMFNYDEVYKKAIFVFNRKENESSLRLQAAKQVIEASKFEDNEHKRMGLIGGIVISDHDEAKLLAIEAVKDYMKASNNFWPNDLKFLQEFPGYDLYDKDSATKKLNNRLDVIELIGSDLEIKGKPRNSLISTLDAWVHWINDSQKSAEESIRIDDHGYRNTASLRLEYRTQFRKDVGGVLSRVEDMKNRIQG